MFALFAVRHRAAGRVEPGTSPAPALIVASGAHRRPRATGSDGMEQLFTGFGRNLRVNHSYWIVQRRGLLFGHMPNDGP